MQMVPHATALALRLALNRIVRAVRGLVDGPTSVVAKAAAVSVVFLAVVPLENRAPMYRYVAHHAGVDVALEAVTALDIPRLG
jgi:hypothetical protein